MGISFFFMLYVKFSQKPWWDSLLNCSFCCSLVLLSCYNSPLTDIAWVHVVPKTKLQVTWRELNTNKG